MIVFGPTIRQVTCVPLAAGSSVNVVVLFDLNG
jgi:hypothetical protein